MKKRANEIIGETLGMNVNDVTEYRYQSTRTSIPVYAIGDTYYCCPIAGRLPPKGWEWRPIEDQFFAQREGRTVYSASGDPEGDA